jgi:hypothetical protein
VFVDHTRTGCQPDPTAGKFALAVQALERLEKLVDVAHVEASAVVGDRKMFSLVLAAQAKSHVRFWYMRAELQSIAEQVGQEHLNQSQVSVDYEVGFDFDSNMRVGS